MGTKKKQPQNLAILLREINGRDDFLVWAAALRWSGGFQCPKCGGDQSSQYANGLRRCLSCRSRISPLAHTYLDHCHVGHDELLTSTWRIAEQGSMSAKQLSDGYDLSYPAALLVLRKIRRSLLEAQIRSEKLSGKVEVDEAFIGGSKSNSGKRGRSRVPAKHLIFCAVERGDSGRCVMKTYDKATKTNLKKFIQNNVATGSTILTDGYVGYRGIDSHGYMHAHTVIDDGEYAAHEALPVVHQSISLLKRRMLATYNRQPSGVHLDSYLAEFCFRWNTRSLSTASRFALLWENLLQTVSREERQ